jgi:hypothetical protein
MNTLARRHGTAVGVLACSLWCASLALAQTTPPDPTPAGSGFRFNGFGTIGLTHTSAPDGWGFRRDISQPPNDGGTRADTDSRLGLQLNYTLNSQIEFVGQVLLKRRVDISPPADSLEWAFASYKPTPDWQIRVGRTNPDAFLLSDYRNVGFAYPWVRPDVGFYGALPMYSLDGFDVTRTWSAGDARWKAKLFSGAGGTYGASDSDQPANKLIAHNISGLTLSREAEGLTLRATALHMRVGLNHVENLQPLSAALQTVQNLPVPSIVAQAAALQRGLSLNPGELTYLELGTSYEGSAWLMSAELSYIDGSFAANHSTNGYASLGRRFGPVTVYGVLAASKSSGEAKAVPDWGSQLAPVLGPQLAQQVQQIGTGAALANNAQRRDQQSVSLGMRWDLNDSMALKLQWDHYHIDANGHQLWSNGTPDAANANVGSVVLDFIF